MIDIAFLESRHLFPHPARLAYHMSLPVILQWYKTLLIVGDMSRPWRVMGDNLYFL